MKNKFILTASVLVMTAIFSSTVYAADPNKTRAEFKAKLAEISGPLGPFARAEDFPKSFFLINQNLPFMVGLSLHHPKSKALKLTTQQKADINKVKDATVPVVLKLAKKIKTTEIVLANKVIEGSTTQKMEKLVDEIGAMRIDLTKKHLHCINQVKDILTDEQFVTLQGYATPKRK